MVMASHDISKHFVKFVNRMVVNRQLLCAMNGDEQFLKFVYFLLLPGPTSDVTLQRYHAQEDPELCQERPRETDHGQRGSCRRRQFGRDPGG